MEVRYEALTAVMLKYRSPDLREGYNGQWKICTEEILTNNGVTLNAFRDTVKDLFIRGRGKYRNVIITGSANCDKTFLLNPLTLKCNTFCNPAARSFPWVGVLDMKCIVSE